jgi:hypothetical protein
MVDDTEYLLRSESPMAGIDHIAHNRPPWPPANSSLAAEQVIRANYVYAYHVCDAATVF